ncbi:MAG: hypothetical protein IJ394_08145 [Bacteroidales bacterium]|nr:hypothetical protein [Bacteroidales bacterium]
MKSIFTKLSTLLFCGVVAMVGCTDFSEDIQAVDKKVDGLTTELNNYKTSTAATIAELQSAIAALEATQERMAADYAKKSELEAAKSELQDKLNTLNSNIEKAAADAAAAIAALDAAKADKSEVVALKETVEAAIAEANAAIAALDAAKADKTQVDQIAGDVATLIEGYQQMIAQFQNLSLIVDGKAEQADLELVQADVNSLKQGYMETVSALQNLAGRMEAAEGAIELAEGDIADLKKAAAEAVFAITNLNAQVEALDARVEALEGEMKKVQSEIALHTEALQNLAGRLEAAEGAIEDEAAARAKADEALQEAVSLLNMGLTNLQVAYNVHIEEFEAYKDNMAKAIEALELQDALIYKTIQDNFNTLITSIDETAAALRAEQAEAIAALEKKIVEAWEAERALIYNTIADIQKTLFAAIEEGDAALQEAMEAADALIYKTIDSYRSILEIAILEGDAAEAEAREAADALIYNTIADIQKTLMAAVEEGDAAVLETVAAQLEEELALVYNTINSIKDELFIAIEEGDAATAEAAQAALDEAIALVYKTIGSTKADLQAEIADLNANLTTYVDDAVALIYKTIASNKADLQAEIEDLRTELNALVETVNMDVEALLARVQSLVYVPAYNDHKGDINFALVNAGVSADQEIPTVLVPVNTVLKYRVQTADYDAAKAASELAAAWKSKLANLYFEIEQVKVRTRAAAEPVLNILDVTAEGEYLVFTTLAQNFAEDFYNEEISYSTALVLTDGNNNRSTEYVNLVPNCVDTYNMVLYAGEGEDLAVFYGSDVIGADNLPAAFQTEDYDDYYIAANDPETVKTLVRPSLGFIPTQNATDLPTIYSAEDLAELGFNMGDVKFDVLWGKLTVTNNSDGASFVDANSQIQFIKGTPDWTVKLTDKCTFDMVGKSAVLTYKYTWAGQTISLGHKVEVSNAQVAVNMEVTDTWTVAKQDAVFEKTHYALPYLLDSVAFEAVGGPVAHLTPVLNAPAVMKEGYPKFYVKDAAGEWKETETRSFKLAKFNDNKTADIEMVGGTYSWNNSYKIVWVSTNTNEHVDYTTTAIVNLVGRPEKIDVEIPVEFVLKGTNSWFEAPADLCGEAFKQLDQYLEYGDTAADKAKWESIFQSYVTRYNAVELGMPVVNGETSKWIANLDQLATAKLFIGKNKINEGTPNVITWSVTPWWGVPVNFTVTGNIVIPEYEFIYSEDYVKNATATVYGQIEKVEGDNETGATGVYNIIKSDLAKYFNVDAESLNGHDYTVEFEVVAPEATEDEYVEIGPATTVDVLADKGAATYYYLQQDSAVLDWATYRGLKVLVNATLKVNGFERETLPLTLVTEDPLTLTGADIAKDRKLREDLDIKVFESLVLTSSVEDYKNLLTTDKKAAAKNGSNIAADLDAAEAYAASVYGADIEVVLGTKGVYYYNNSGELIILGTNKYNYEAETGILTIYGDDAQVKNYYADFTAIMDSRICGGQHQVPFRVVASLKK